MVLTIDKTHELKGNGYLLGVASENESEQLVINIAYDLLLNKWAYIEFEQDGEKHTTERLTANNGQIVYNLPNGILKQGHVTIQVVFRDASGFVWKSFARRFVVNESINACCNLPETHPDFITEAQKIIDGIENQNAKIDAFLSSDAETARVTAENERQANETARVDAENARRTEFSGWANSLGNLNTYDKRLINLEEATIGTLCEYQTDNTMAYSKTVPARALPYARLNKVGGAVKSVVGNAIPSGIQSLDGYGFDVNATCYNYIDFERKVFVKKVGILNLGSLSFTTFDEERRVYKAAVYGKKFGIDNIKCEIYKTTDVKAVEMNNMEYRGNNTDIALFIRNTSYASVDSFKIAMNGVYMYYELATPIETDISAYLTDNYIRVEPNGSIVFENDNAQAVPSEIIYTVKR